MKVLIVSTARELGGAELYIERLIAPLAARCEFTVALSDHANLLPLAQRLGKLAVVKPFPFERTSALPGIVRELQRLAQSHDVVHINSNHPASRLGILMGFALAGRGTPAVCVEHRVSPVSDVLVPRALAPVLPLLFRASRRKVQRLVAVSQDNAQALTALYRIPPNKVQVVYPGVQLSAHEASPTGTLRAELQLPAHQRIVLVLARINPNKGHRFLIQAAPKILSEFPDVHIVFAGAPDEVVPLQQQLAELNLADKFSLLGFRTDSANLLRSSDVYVLPSLAEGFSATLIEALAAGLPVVATRVGGAAEIIVEGETGFLVPPGDAAALADAVLRVLRLSAPALQHMRATAMTLARQFTPQVMGAKTLAIYEQVSASAATPPPAA